MTNMEPNVRMSKLIFCLSLVRQMQILFSVISTIVSILTYKFTIVCAKRKNNYKVCATCDEDSQFFQSLTDMHTSSTHGYNDIINKVISEPADATRAHV